MSTIPEQATLSDLVAVVLDPARTEMEKRLAMSVAYHKGVNEGLSLAADSIKRHQPVVHTFTPPTQPISHTDVDPPCN